MDRRGRAGLFGALLVAMSPAFGDSHSVTAAAPPGPTHSAGAIINGTVLITILSPTLKHWGVPAAEVVFVPDSDQSDAAQAIRSAADTEALCDAIQRAVGRDPSIAAAPVDSDGDLEHRSGDEARLSFQVKVYGAASSARGILYLCSRPIVAVVGRGAYPSERLERTESHRLSWSGDRISLRPGTETRVNGTASLDASQW